MKLNLIKKDKLITIPIFQIVEKDIEVYEDMEELYTKN